MAELTQNIFNLSIPVAALDIVIFTVYKEKLCVALIVNPTEPQKGKYMLPGGIVRSGLSLEENFDSILEKKTGIKNVYKEQLYTFWDTHRDTRGHVISIAYYALVRQEELLKTLDFTKSSLVPYDEVKNLDFAFCHDEILAYAKQRLDWKISYTNVIGNILPKRFTLSMMQASYESILGKELDKRNFRKKILSLDVLEETNEYDKSFSNRPAKLYEFKASDLQIIEML